VRSCFIFIMYAQVSGGPRSCHRRSSPSLCRLPRLMPRPLLLPLPLPRRCPELCRGSRPPRLPGRKGCLPPLVGGAAGTSLVRRLPLRLLRKPASWCGPWSLPGNGRRSRGATLRPPCRAATCKRPTRRRSTPPWPFRRFPRFVLACGVCAPFLLAFSFSKALLCKYIKASDRNARTLIFFDILCVTLYISRCQKRC